MTCPNCGLEQYYVCDNPKCVCRERVPKGALPQTHLEYDVLACPYCGFEAHYDFWEELEYKGIQNENSKS